MSYTSIYDFPNPEFADPDGQGLVCIGGDLDPATLLHAYSQGLFPWFNDGDPICWWCPEPRCIIYPEQFVPSKSLLRNMRKWNYQIRIDHAFSQVLQQCAAPRNYTSDTWITDQIKQSYTKLHQLGYAHSIEIWDDNDLIGGLYGINIGRGFFGESMFNRRTDTSKMAFYVLMLLCKEEQCPWVDCQLPNDHLLSLNATTLSRKKFLESLHKVIKNPNIDWKVYQNGVFSTDKVASHQHLSS